MALFLSKFLPAFLLPLGLALVILAAGLICWWLLGSRKRLGRILVIISLVTLWVAGSPFFANRLLSSLEGQYVSRAAAASPEADAIVVLGGGAGMDI